MAIGISAPPGTQQFSNQKTDIRAMSIATMLFFMWGFLTCLNDILIPHLKAIFDLGEVADDFGVDPGDGLEFSGPVLGVVGPRDPGGGVRGPLGGHTVVGRHVVGAAQWYPLPVKKFAKSSNDLV